MLFLAKSTTVGHTDVRTERKMKRFRTGTPALCRRSVGVKIANTKKLFQVLFIAILTNAQKTKTIFAAILNQRRTMAVYEPRLIDADKVEIGFKELCESPYFKSDVSAKHGAETLMDLCVRTDSHKPNTIDPETLPIVQEFHQKLVQEQLICNNLQKDLVQVAMERNSACKQLLECASLLRVQCLCCIHYTDRVPCVKCKDGSQWEWRGPDEEDATAKKEEADNE
ncbi:hypothetical protein [Subdoligranulum variabile]|uniref:hypothetical protein n=2 Tax=Subdoligranulum variabile TaxID=214851 RepID=UPI001A984C52|nr:hypothetical protein [Subdoligranulum variabile]